MVVGVSFPYFATVCACLSFNTTALLLFDPFGILIITPLAPQPCMPPLTTCDILIDLQCECAFAFQQWPPDLL